MLAALHIYIVWNFYRHIISVAQHCYNFYSSFPFQPSRGSICCSVGQSSLSSSHLLSSLSALSPSGLEQSSLSISNSSQTYFLLSKLLIVPSYVCLSAIALLVRVNLCRYDSQSTKKCCELSWVIRTSKECCSTALKYWTDTSKIIWLCTLHLLEIKVFVCQICGSALGFGIFTQAQTDQLCLYCLLSTLNKTDY